MQSSKSLARLIVWALAVLVASIGLQQVLARQHEAARKAMCLNNLKSIAQSLKMYCADYDGMLPSSYLSSRSSHWNASDFAAFTTTVGKYPPEAHEKRTVWQVLHNAMRTKDIVWCPSDEVDKTDPHARTSYWYKLAMDKAWYGVGCAKPRRSMNDYVFESDQLAFYERLGWHFGDEKGLHNGVQINAAFMDTHVETILISNATSGDPINCAANTDGEPMYYNQHNDLRTGESKVDTGPAKHTDPTIYSDKL